MSYIEGITDKANDLSARFPKDCFARYSTKSYHYDVWYITNSIGGNVYYSYYDLDLQSVTYSNYIVPTECPETEIYRESNYYTSRDLSSGNVIAVADEYCIKGMRIDEPGECVSESDMWEDKIDDNELDPCILEILSELTNINTGIGKVLSDFFNQGPVYSWKIELDNLGSNNETAVTIIDFTSQTMVTTINRDRILNASDLSIARTLIHEAVHAQLVYFRINDPSAALESYAEILLKYGQNLNPNDQDHIKMTEDLIGFITVALKEYGQSLGYNIDDFYYSALAWGGLMDTPAFNAFPNSTEQEIIEVNQIELTGQDADQNAVDQKGGENDC